MTNPEPENTPEFIKWLFNYRCVGIDIPCYKLARDVSHIRPRQVDDTWQNKVLHCGECHAEWHRRGVSDDAIEKMQKRRVEHLEIIGKSSYI